eukprot:Sspe_Gene.75382::Locus_47104_Transcript_2_2_Confidence_0.667_Length_844::g.75382::m.75382
MEVLTPSVREATRTVQEASHRRMGTTRSLQPEVKQHPVLVRMSQRTRGGLSALIAAGARLPREVEEVAATLHLVLVCQAVEGAEAVVVHLGDGTQHTRVLCQHKLSPDLRRLDISLPSAYFDPSTDLPMCDPLSATLCGAMLHDALEGRMGRKPSTGKQWKKLSEAERGGYYPPGSQQRTAHDKALGVIRITIQCRRGASVLGRQNRYNIRLDVPVAEVAGTIARSDMKVGTQSVPLAECTVQTRAPLLRARADLRRLRTACVA